MRITSVNIPREEIFNELNPLKMERLGQVVLLAGKNGSGKSRVLDLIENLMKGKPTLADINHSQSSVDELNKEIDDTFFQIEQTKTALLRVKEENQNRALDQIQRSEDRIKSFKEQVEGHQGILEWNFIETEKLEDKHNIVRYVPKNLKLTDYRDYTLREIESHAENSRIIGISELAKSSLAQLHTLQKKWFESTHQHYDGSDDAKNFHQHNYERMQALLQTFLGVQLERDKNGEPTLFDMHLGDAKLSDGQKVLLQLCVAIHSQGDELAETVLFMDEPENHLHPSAILDVIDKIVENIPDGQLWIATHSIALLSHFETSSIHYVEDGQVSYAGNIPEQVLESLLGDDDRIYKLQDFISLPGVMALNQYAFECLFHPEVVMTDKDDKQVLQITEQLAAQIGEKTQVRIVDFGSGQGRLIANINESAKGKEIIHAIDYVAYDPYPEYKAECVKSIEMVYGSADKRYYNNLPDLITDHDSESFDVVVLCNVLHEIEPNDWLSLFKNEGDIQELLNKTGAVLIVEDELMPRGEKAYQKGFIVLDTADLKALFQIKTTDKGFIVNEKKDGRLKAHQIPKEYLGRISTETRTKALKSINKKAKKEILKVRGEAVSYRNGRKHGFWIQQFANTSLALADYE